MQLAREFGYANVDKFLEDVPSHQVVEWIALREQEPWGEELFYRFFANVAARICQSMGSRIEPDAFLPACWKDKPATNLDFKGLMAMAQRG